MISFNGQAVKILIRQAADVKILRTLIPLCLRIVREASPQTSAICQRGRYPGLRDAESFSKSRMPRTMSRKWMDHWRRLHNHQRHG